MRYVECYPGKRYSSREIGETVELKVLECVYNSFEKCHYGINFKPRKVFKKLKNI